MNNNIPEHTHIPIKISEYEELKEQTERVEELERSRKTLSDNHFQQIEQHKYLIQQNKRYRKALEFYADLKNWRKSHTERVNNSPSKVIADTGDKAREELESESE